MTGRRAAQRHGASGDIVPTAAVQRQFVDTLHQLSAVVWEMHPDDRPWCVNVCTVASQECRDHAFVYRARNADGRVLWIKDVVRVIPDETGTRIAMRGIMLDVTEEIGVPAPGHGHELDYDAPEVLRVREVLAA